MDTNWEPLISERKVLSRMLSALEFVFVKFLYAWDSNRKRIVYDILPKTAEKVTLYKVTNKVIR